MVNGIDLFKRKFEPFSNAYVLIGGTASSLLMDKNGLEFRATKDIDIVLYIEALTKEFAEAFWEFIEEGGYKNQQRSTGQPCFYRFEKPENGAYPAMIEIFSRQPEVIDLHDDSRLTPIPFGEEVSSLSAILLDEDYYSLAKSGRTYVDGLPILGAEHLILFKAKAWLDLTARQETGQTIDDKSIRKHKYDIFRLYRVISPETRLQVPHSVAEDLRRFIAAMKASDLTFSQKDLQRVNIKQALQTFREVYGLLDSGGVE